MKSELASGEDGEIFVRAVPDHHRAAVFIDDDGVFEPAFEGGGELVAHFDLNP